MFLIYWVDNQVKTQSWEVKDVGEQTVSLVREVVKNICKEDKIRLKLGWYQGLLPYEDEKLRLDVWQKLVAKAITNLQKEPLKAV
jgi:hypothetical protein